MSSTCDWSFPGENRFRGDKLRAVDRYTDIPAAVRNQLKAKIKAREPDDIAEIERHTIVGRRGVYTNMRDMYFGVATLCNTVTRPNWPTGRVERAPVYTVDGYSIMIPDVCGNVARVDWAPLNGAKQSEIRNHPFGAPAAKRVPEPSALALAIPALLALVIQRRRKLAGRQ